MTIIETSAGQFYRVRETNDPDLAHVWYGVRVKRAKVGFVDSARLIEELVRKAGCRVIVGTPGRSVAHT